MKTTIDNNQRVFMVTDSTGNKVLCNLHDLQDVIESFEDKTYLKLFHIWNNTFEKASLKMVRDMLRSANYSIYSPYILN